MIRLVALALFLVPTLAVGQTPDGHGEVSTPTPTYRGTTANAPIPPHMHLKNEGGSDGAGLCVICSVIIAGQYAGVPGLEGGKDSDLWRAAKARPGGYYPAKLESLLGEKVPGQKWISYSDTDKAKLDIVMHTLSATGRPIGATMNTGALYGYKPIHHMIVLNHYESGGLACVIDNNDPGLFHWMPATEFLDRLMDMGEGWVFAWSRLPPVVQVGISTLACGAVALLLVAAAALSTAAAVLVFPE